MKIKKDITMIDEFGAPQGTSLKLHKRKTGANLKPIIMSKKSTPKYRDAETGKYVPKKYADKHPKTTVKETDKKRK